MMVTESAESAESFDMFLTSQSPHIALNEGRLKGPNDRKLQAFVILPKQKPFRKPWPSGLAWHQETILNKLKTYENMVYVHDSYLFSLFCSSLRGVVVKYMFDSNTKLDCSLCSEIVWGTL